MTEVTWHACQLLGVEIWEEELILQNKKNLRILGPCYLYNSRGRDWASLCCQRLSLLLQWLQIKKDYTDKVQSEMMWFTTEKNQKIPWLELFGSIVFSFPILLSKCLFSALIGPQSQQKQSWAQILLACPWFCWCGQVWAAVGSRYKLCFALFACSWG